jgi:hypothetical protein
MTRRQEALATTGMLAQKVADPQTRAPIVTALSMLGLCMIRFPIDPQRPCARKTCLSMITPPVPAIRDADLAGRSCGDLARVLLRTGQFVARYCVKTYPGKFAAVGLLVEATVSIRLPTRRTPDGWNG